MSDVERIAEVIVAHQDLIYIEPGIFKCVCESSMDGTIEAHAAHQAQQLADAGFGHVPTALHQAADEVETEGAKELPWPRNEDVQIGWYQSADWLRARADRAGGTT